MPQILTSAYVQQYADTSIGLWTAVTGAPAPVVGDPRTTDPGTKAAGWYGFGLLDADAGIKESVSHDEAEKYALQGLALVRTIRSKEKRPVTLTMLEENAAVLNTLNPEGTVATVTAGTAEVQTVTISGTPVAGTFDLTLPNYGTASGLTVVSSALPTQGAVQTAVQAAWGIAATVALSGAVYTITFPTSAGNVPAITTFNALTGGTSPALAVATGTPGVNPVLAVSVKPSTSLNIRQFCLDLVSGSGIWHRRHYKAAELVQSGEVSLATGTDLSAFAFTLNPYPDNNGNTFIDYTNNPQYASGQFV